MFRSRLARSNSIEELLRILSVGKSTYLFFINKIFSLKWTRHIKSDDAPLYNSSLRLFFRS